MKILEDKCYKIPMKTNNNKILLCDLLIILNHDILRIMIY